MLHRKIRDCSKLKSNILLLFRSRLIYKEENIDDNKMGSKQQQKLLRDEIAKVQRLFPRDHPRFQIIRANTDELTAKFIVGNGQQPISVFANFPEDPTETLPFWSTDSELPMLVELLEQMSAKTPPSPLGQQIAQIYTALCTHFGLPPLASDENADGIEMEGAGAKCFMAKDVPKVAEDNDGGSGYGREEEQKSKEMMEDEEEAEEEEEDSDIDEQQLEEDVDEIMGNYEERLQEEEKEKQRKLEEAAAIPSEALAQIERAKKKARNNENIASNSHNKVGGLSSHVGSSSSSVLASDRLMKEFKALFKCEGFKNGVFSAELVDDNLYDWHVKLMKVDEDSPLAADLRKLSTQGKPAYLLFHFVFPAAFPFEPPFVRLISPFLKAFSGHLTRAGAICMELLTKQGWSSAYSIEALLIQLAATLVAGEARVEFDNNAGLVYTLENARFSYQNLVRVHGWDGGASSAAAEPEKQ